jgi:hypothetical protein
MASEEDEIATLQAERKALAKGAGKSVASTSKYAGYDDVLVDEDPEDDEPPARSERGFPITFCIPLRKTAEAPHQIATGDPHKRNKLGHRGKGGGSRVGGKYQQLKKNLNSSPGYHPPAAALEPVNRRARGPCAPGSAHIVAHAHSLPPSSRLPNRKAALRSFTAPKALMEVNPTPSTLNSEP